MKLPAPLGRRLLPWTGAALLVVFSIGAPDGAKARTYKPTGPPFSEGDPTADDQPSPTPKPNRLTNQAPTALGGVSSKDVLSGARLVWLSYVRVWIRISLR